MTVTLVKLAFAGIRSRLIASVITIIIAAAAVATIVVGLEVRATGNDPWQQTFARANGADVLAAGPSRTDAVAIGRMPGVTERDAAAPFVLSNVDRHPDELVHLEGMRGSPVVNRPLRTSGSGVRDGGVVLERSLADALGLSVGDTLRLTRFGAEHPVGLKVLGTAVVPSQARFPRSKPGLAWVTPGTLARVAPDRSAWQWSEAVRISDPSAASAFTARAAAAFPKLSRSGSLYFETWQALRANVLADSQDIQVVVTMFTILLLAIALVVVAILVGARAADQRRQIGLLKAVGFTPGQVGFVFALESIVLGLVAAALGFALGAILAPRLAAPVAQTLIGSPAAAPNPWHIVIACCIVLPVLFAAALTSTRRSTRLTTVEAIHAGTVSPSKSRIATAVRSLLPLTAEVGVSALLARGRRMLLLAAAIGLTGAVAVIALSFQATLNAGQPGSVSDVPVELRVLVYTLSGVLLAISATTLIAVTLLAVRERIRDYGALKTIGFTPGQVVSTVISSHTALAVLASVVAIPVGVGLYLALYAVAGGDAGQGAVIAPWWSLVLVPVGTVITAAAATSLPASAAGRVRPADALRYE